MNVRDLPIVNIVCEYGAQDSVFDSLLLVGPVLVVLIATLGRSIVTELLALAYVAVFLITVLYRSRGG
ncbi:hypothetical protein [Halorhabdus rudnickae]|uniref:hypothetical protein n=1 Tax=Halorhabdus rudnickae TaxID=1775544 RepID=UPI0010845D83|nr:hypothetical protein [Halorhabdus rudnickae]